MRYKYLLLLLLFFAFNQHQLSAQDYVANEQNQSSNTSVKAFIKHPDPIINRFNYLYNNENELGNAIDVNQGYYSKSPNNGALIRRYEHAILYDQAGESTWNRITIYLRDPSITENPIDFFGFKLLEPLEKFEALMKKTNWQEEIRNFAPDNSFGSIDYIYNRREYLLSIHVDKGLVTNITCIRRIFKK